MKHNGEDLESYTTMACPFADVVFYDIPIETIEKHEDKLWEAFFAVTRDLYEESGELGKKIVIRYE